MLNKSYDYRGFKKLTHYLNIVMKIIFWFCTISIIIALIGSIIISFIPNERFLITQDGNSFFSITMDQVLSYKLELLGTVNIKSTILSIILGASAISVLLLIIIKQVSLILGTIETDNPFDLLNARRISIIGFIMIIAGFLIRAIEFIIFHIIINTHAIKYIQLTYKPDIGTILVGLLLLVLAGIFRHGNYLQNEYDTTL